MKKPSKVITVQEEFANRIGASGLLKELIFNSTIMFTISKKKMKTEAITIFPKKGMEFLFKKVQIERLITLARSKLSCRIFVSLSTQDNS